MKVMVLEPLALEEKSGEHLRRCNIKRIDGDVQVERKELWFRFPKSIAPPEDKDCDSYLLAICMDAMEEGRNIIVKGSVSKGLLSNLMEYQAAWNKWLPDVYKIIEIDVDSVRSNETPVSGAVCAFSGGVDSTFTVWRHSQGMCSYRSQEIKLCAFVHGFDIPLAKKDEFDSAFNRAAETLGEINIKLTPISTNYRKIARTNWEHAFVCALVVTLSNFKRVAGTCLIGSSNPYDSLVIPWGSNPITDHLLSSGEFNVIHDGASHNRTEKVNFISSWTAGIENLRVCWQGDLKDRNCGECEKCLRTKLNFLATGNPIPSCFADFLKGDLPLKGVVLSNDVIRAEWKQISEYAKQNGVEGEWVNQVNWVIWKSRVFQMTYAFWKRFKRIPGKLKRIVNEKL